MRRVSGPRSRAMRRIAVLVACSGKRRSRPSAGQRAFRCRRMAAGGAQSRQRRRAHAQHRVVAQRREMARVQARADRQAQLQLAQALVERAAARRPAPTPTPSALPDAPGRPACRAPRRCDGADRDSARRTRSRPPRVTVERAACHRPYSGGASSGSAVRSTISASPGALTIFASSVWNGSCASVGPRREVVAARAAAARLRAAASHRPGTSPATLKPGSLMSIGRLPSPSGAGAARSRRTSDSKSPPSPVRNCQWW